MKNVLKSLSQFGDFWLLQIIILEPFLYEETKELKPADYQLETSVRLKHFTKKIPRRKRK